MEYQEDVLGNTQIQQPKSNSNTLIIGIVLILGLSLVAGVVVAVIYLLRKINKSSDPLSSDPDIIKTKKTGTLTSGANNIGNYEITFYKNIKTNVVATTIDVFGGTLPSKGEILARGSIDPVFRPTVEKQITFNGSFSGSSRQFLFVFTTYGDISILQPNSRDFFDAGSFSVSYPNTDKAYSI